MVQVGSTVNVIDNCGAKKAYCIRIIQNSKKKSAHIGDLILVVVKALRKKRRSFSIQPHCCELSVSYRR